MKIELTTNSTKKFLLISLLSIPLIMFLSIGLAVLTSTKGLVLLIIPLLGLSIFLGHKGSLTKTKIDMNESDKFRIDNQEIPYNNVIGYFINETGLTHAAICLRLNTNKSIQITSSTIGENGKKFRNAEVEIIEQLKKKNPRLLELEYQDIYVRQTNILRPILYIMTGIIVIIDIVALFLIFSGKMKLPWQIFFVNSLLIGLMPYMKKGKINNANTPYTAK